MPLPPPNLGDINSGWVYTGGDPAQGASWTPIDKVPDSFWNALDQANHMGNFMRGVHQGVDELKVDAGGLAAAAGDATGLQGLKTWGMQTYQNQQQDSQMYARPTDDLSGVHGVGDALAYAAHTAGSFAPTLASLVATDGIGGLAAKGLAGAAGKRAAEDAIASYATKDEAASAAAKAAATVRSRAGQAAVAGTMYGQDLGSNYAANVQNGNDDLGSSAMYSIPATVAGFVGEFPGVKGLMGLGHESNDLLDWAVDKGRTKAVAAGAAQQGALMAGGAVGQAFFDRMAQNQPTSGDAANAAYLNAGVSGLISGGLMGGTIGAMHHPTDLFQPGGPSPQDQGQLSFNGGVEQAISSEHTPYWEQATAPNGAPDWYTPGATTTQPGQATFDFGTPADPASVDAVMAHQQDANAQVAQAQVAQMDQANAVRQDTINKLNAIKAQHQQEVTANENIANTLFHQFGLPTWEIDSKTGSPKTIRNKATGVAAPKYTPEFQVGADMLNALDGFPADSPAYKFVPDMVQNVVSALKLQKPDLTTARRIVDQIQQMKENPSGEDSEDIDTQSTGNQNAQNVGQNAVRGQAAEPGRQVVEQDNQQGNRPAAPGGEEARQNVAYKDDESAKINQLIAKMSAEHQMAAAAFMGLDPEGNIDLSRNAASLRDLSNRYGGSTELWRGRLKSAGITDALRTELRSEVEKRELAHTLAEDDRDPEEHAQALGETEGAEDTTPRTSDDAVLDKNELSGQTNSGIGVIKNAAGTQSDTGVGVKGRNYKEVAKRPAARKGDGTYLYSDDDLNTAVTRALESNDGEAVRSLVQEAKARMALSANMEKTSPELAMEAGHRWDDLRTNAEPEWEDVPSSVRKQYIKHYTGWASDNISDAEMEDLHQNFVDTHREKIDGRETENAKPHDGSNSQPRRNVQDGDGRAKADGSTATAEKSGDTGEAARATAAEPDDRGSSPAESGATAVGKRPAKRTAAKPKPELTEEKLRAQDWIKLRARLKKLEADPAHKDLARDYLSRAKHDESGEVFKEAKDWAEAVEADKQEPIEHADASEKWSDEAKDQARSRIISQYLETKEAPKGQRIAVTQRLSKVLNRLHSGKINSEQVVHEIQSLTSRLIERNETKVLTRSVGRKRGADMFREKLLNAKRNGWISPEEADFTEWMIAKNPELLNDAALSVRAAPESSKSAGSYSPAARLVTLFKDHASDTTAVHEILHHLERMMPADMQKAITDEWAKRIASEYKTADPKRREMLDAIMEANALPTKASMDSAIDKLQSYDDYALVNPSEFWAVNGTRILEGQYGAKDSIFGRIGNWMKEVVEKLKAIVGMKSDAPLYKALSETLKGGPEFQSKGMLTKATEYSDLKRGSEQDKLVARNIERLPERLQEPVYHITNTIRNVAQKGMYKLSFVHDLVDQIADKIPSAREFLKVISKRGSIRRDIEHLTDSVVSKWNNLDRKSDRAVSQFIKDATLEGKWFRKYDWNQDSQDETLHDSALAARYKELSPEARDVVDSVFKHGMDTYSTKLNAISENAGREYQHLIDQEDDPTKKQELIKERNDFIAKVDKSYTQLKGPYAPLRRFGDWIVSFKSDKYRDMESIAKGESEEGSIDEAKKWIAENESNPDHHMVDMYETYAQAKAAQRALGSNADVIEKSKWGEENHVPWAYMRRISDLARNMEMDKPAERAIQKAAADMYLTLLHESSARKSELRRRGIAGQNIDMKRSFATNGRANAHLIASILHSGDVTDILYRMHKESNTGRGDEREEKSKAFNAILAHHVANLSSGGGRWQDKCMAMASVYNLLATPAHYLQGLSQPLMMTLPALSGRFGAGRSWGEMWNAYRDLAKIIGRKNVIGSLPLDIDKHVAKLPREVEMLGFLRDHGMLDTGIDGDLGRWDSQEGVGASFNHVVQRLGMLERNMWSANGVAASLASYRMMFKDLIAHGMGQDEAHAKAQDYALHVNRWTLGDWSTEGGPLLFKQGVSNSIPVKMLSQYRKFQLVQLSYFARMAKTAFGDATDEEKAVARSALKWTLAHHFVMAGAMGLPAASLVSWVVGQVFGDESEDNNGEEVLRKAIGDPDIANILLRGAPNLVGWDLSKKLGAGDMLDPTGGYTKIDLSNKNAANETVVGLMGPFVGGLLNREEQAMTHMHMGDYYQGIEALLPKAAADLLKAGRLASQGLTNSRGDVTISPEDMSSMSVMAQALGISTTQLTTKEFKQELLSDMQASFKDQSSVLIHKYNEAYRDGDTGSMADLRSQWIDMNAARRQAGFTPEPFSTLLKAPSEQRKRERMNAAGLEYSESTRQAVQNIQ